MKPGEKLISILNRIDGRGYKAYLDLKGSYDFNSFTLFIDHVQRDPFASPSLLRIEIPDHSFPPDLYQNKTRKIALEDYISRSFAEGIKRKVKGRKGSGKSGILRIDQGGQEVIERSCVNINPHILEIRFELCLPARGRRIMGKEAQRLLTQVLPDIVSSSCFYENLHAEEIARHVQCYENAEHIRDQLIREELVAFIATGSILPRESGISPKPLPRAVAFKSPDTLTVSLETADGNLVQGMGIPEGVTLIVGGGYHGKSTLLQAIELGVYNHIPGDGRELVITREDAVKIRAEDGRRIEKVDVSSFIHQPPGIKDTSNFSTENASGSTSQAANIIEALEAGSKLLLFDEDTSATNFMIRDERMQRLVNKEKEPITPFIDRVGELYHEHGVSTVLVMGGSGDYFQEANTVIMMDNYQPRDVTLASRKIAQEMPINRKAEAPGKFHYQKRYPHPESIQPYKGRKLKLDSRGISTLMIGTSMIDLSWVEQLVESSQTRAIGYALYQLTRYNTGPQPSLTVKNVLDKLDEEINRKGLDFLAPPGRKHPHNLARPRRYEIVAALNRLRSCKMNM